MEIDSTLRTTYDVCMTSTHRKEVTPMARPTKTFTPKELAEDLGVSPKVLRAYLRKNHARPADAKNTSWVIPTPVANDARKAFAKNRASETNNDNS